MLDTTQKLNPPLKPDSLPILRVTNLAVSHDSRFKSFFSNLREFLTARPVKLRPGAPTAFQTPRFGDSLGKNLSEVLRPLPRSARGPVDSDMLVQWQSNFGSFWDNLRSAFAKSKLRKGEPVPDIWTKDTDAARTQALSLAIHVVVLVLILVPFLPQIFSPKLQQTSNVTVTPLDIASPYLPK